jgi:hypothetical protein
MEGKFEVHNEVNRQYRRFNAQGTQLKLRLLHPPDYHDSEVISDPITHFESCVNALFGFALQYIEVSDMVAIVIHNENNDENNQKDKSIGINFRRKDKLSAEIICKLFKKVAQSNAKFNALELLIIRVHSVKIPVGFQRLQSQT